MEDTWHHLKLLPSGHSAPSGFTYDVGNIDNSRAGGVFLMLSEKGGSNVNNKTFTIKTMRNDFGNIADTSIANNDIFLSLAAIEMVYIPYGGYYLGDGAMLNRLANSYGEPIAIAREDTLTVYPVSGGVIGASMNVPATFPKGYKGFYCMKYEVSQEQYVSFLNNLTRAQQKVRIGNNLDSLKVGEYVFGDKSRPNYRNGICVIANSSDAPAVFGCNLNPAEPYFGEDDGKCIACNYLTPADMLAYCDWTCLRPMSEFEFEKACRKPYPQESVAGEYAWNSDFGVNALRADNLLNAGKVSEKPSLTATNVNYDNADFGPVRSASFGTSNSTQTQAGATFWGLMEMSGNVAEMCYSVNAGSNFNTSDVSASHGNGEIDASGASDVATTIWYNTAASFIAKGGSFASMSDDEITISDRSRDTVSNVRDSTIGFRAVHTFGGGGNFTIDAGTITSSEYTCPNLAIELSSVTKASCMDMQIFYSWYVKLPGSTTFKLIEGEAKDVLTYLNNTSRTSSMQTFTFKRTATCAVGEASTEFSVKLAPYPFTTGESTFSAGSTVSIATNDVVELFSFALQESPASFYLTPTSKQVNVNVGDYCALTFYLIGHINDGCTDSVVRTISINGEIPYSGAYKSVTLAAGTYSMECWGAQGGTTWANRRSSGYSTYSGKYGGYAKGDIELKGDLKLYIYVGGKGSDGTTKQYGGAGGWNGGGKGGDDGTASSNDDTGGGGGGGTDIRLTSGNLYSRIMVAGGGAGGNTAAASVGTGGGITGGTDSYSRQGTQTTGYAFGTGAPGGAGGDGKTAGGGAGGGYWGGKGGSSGSTSDSQLLRTGGGGSGFVSGMSGCNAVASSDSSSPSGSPNHYSGYVFTNASMSTGARSGNGLVRITRLR
jgi:formylglycine-generating enzyme required for sulfatase activity